MSITITMDRAGRVVLPRPVRDRLGLTGSRSHRMELIEAPEGIMLKPVGADVPATRDASGWVVFHSDVDDQSAESTDAAALVDALRERRTRQRGGE